jgi:hypothetical protein
MKRFAMTSMSTWNKYYLINALATENLSMSACDIDAHLSTACLVHRAKVCIQMPGGHFNHLEQHVSVV